MAAITIGEMIDRVQTLYNKGVKSDDTRLKDRYVYSKLKTVWGKLITQKIIKKQFISDWSYTVLPCVELIPVANHECPCIPDLGCKVYRTRYSLPKSLSDLNEHIIRYVMNITSGSIISPSTRETYIHNQGNKFTSQGLRYIIEKGHIFVYGKNVPTLIKIKYLPEDPIEALAYPSFCGDCKDCDDCIAIRDMVFPIDGDMIDDVIEMTNIEIAKYFVQGREDLSNNAVDSIREEAK